MTQNLWGDLATTENIRTPYIILMEQASVLKEITNGLLIGHVQRETTANNASFNAVLQIIAPSLNNYAYVVLRIGYALENLYPVKIYAPEFRDKDFSVESYEHCINAKDEKEFLTYLETILSSKRVKGVIASLLAQIQAEAKAA